MVLPSPFRDRGRALLVAVCTFVALPLLAFVHEPASSASTQIALTVDDLVERSDVLVVATAKSRMSRWEESRIVTYTTMIVDTPVAGAQKGDTLLVRTLGGVVGDIGQKVIGEAVFPLEKQTLVFLRPLPGSFASFALGGARGVVGMEQGAIPVVLATDKVPRLASAMMALDVVNPPTAKDVPARLALADRPVADALTDLRARWIAHGKK